MVAEVVYFSVAKGGEEATKPVMESKPLVDTAYFTFSVDVDFAAHVMVTQNARRNSRDDIVVVHPAIVAYLKEGSVLSVSDARCTEAKDGLRVRGNGREFAAYCADGSHGTAERVASEPDGALVLTQMGFDIWPEQIDVGVEAAVHTSDFASDRPGFRVSGDIVPFGWLGSACYHKAIESSSEHVGF